MCSVKVIDRHRKIELLYIQHVIIDYLITTSDHLLPQISGPLTTFQYSCQFEKIYQQIVCYQLSITMWQVNVLMCTHLTTSNFSNNSHQIPLYKT